MNRSLTILALASALALTAGCNRAESPNEVASDVSEARQEAAQENAEASRDAAEEINDATQDSGVVTTSWPSPTPSMRSATSIVTVPELYARTVRPPKNSESVSSNLRATGPVVIQPDRSTSATPRIVSSSISGRVSGRKEAVFMTDTTNALPARRQR